MGQMIEGDIGTGISKGNVLLIMRGLSNYVKNRLPIGKGLVEPKSGCVKLFL